MGEENEINFPGCCRMQVTEGEVWWLFGILFLPVMRPSLLTHALTPTQLGSFSWALGLGAGAVQQHLASLKACVAYELCVGYRRSAPSPQHVIQGRVCPSGLEMIPGFNPFLLLNHFGSKLYLHVIITLKSHYSRHLVLAITFKVAKQFP